MGDLPNLANVDYLARVNRAIDHITNHLTEPHKLEDVARIACFSPYHFHRIFKAATGETLKSFVKRVRIERAVYLLSHRKGASLTEVALACGFSSSSDFSRSFRAHYGVPPRAFDLERFRRTRRDAMKRALTPEDERERLAGLPRGENPDGFEAEIVLLPARTIAYIRVLRPFDAGGVTGAAERLLGWARARGLENGQWLGYMWDDPDIVALERCRYDVGVVVPPDTEVGGEVCLVRFPEMKIAEVDVAGPIDLEMRALDWLYLTWLPTSGYAPAHQPAFEAWKGEPFAHGQNHFELKVQLALVDASQPL